MTAAIKQVKPRYDVEYGFEDKVKSHGLNLAPTKLDTLQINITKLCNQQCFHCHVDSSPRRREMMDDRTIDQVIKVIEQNPGIGALDITGGAPELHARFREVVQRVRGLGRRVMVRHNLTVTLDPHPMTGESLEYLPDFFKEHGVEVVSSLPYYQEFFTDKQRGDGVFQKSIESLHRLNRNGFGVEGSGLLLNLVYNPVGSFLPPPQAQLESDYKRELKDRFNIVFNQLFAIANMPIHRFKFQLKRSDTYEDYMQTLVGAFNPVAAQTIMCRNLISISYDGTLYDCDFNQMLEMAIGGEKPVTIFDFEESLLSKRDIRVADHCFGCTAGAGSSCGGSTT